MTPKAALDVLRQGATRPDGTLAQDAEAALMTLGRALGLEAAPRLRLEEPPTPLRMTPRGATPEKSVWRVDRSQCQEQVCYCHDDSSWRPGLYPDGCSSCGCRWAEAF